jgi:hypothetical protein
MGTTFFDAAGSAFFGPGGGSPAPAGIAWAPVLGLVAPFYDPNSVFNSLTEIGGGVYDLGLNNAVAVAKLTDGCAFRLPTPAGWVDDGTCTPMWRVTAVAAPAAASKNWWVAAGVTDKAGDPGAVGALSLAAGIVNGAAFVWQMILSGETSMTTRPSNPTAQVVGWFIPAIDIAGGAALDFGCMVGRNDRSIIYPRETILTGSGALDFNLFAGCNSATADGPHVARFKVEYAMSKVTG